MNIDKSTTLQTGAKLQNGRYTIVKVLGQGGFGITYQATTKEAVTGNLGKMEVEVPVAIKEFFMKETCLRNQETANISIPSTGSAEQVDKYRQKFIKEAHNLASLNHPNIVHVADVFEENNTVYYVMQFLKNGSLREQLREKGPLSEAEALKYTIQVGEALEYMHNEKHMCHYDVKPGNILLNGDKAMLIDFGISKNYTSDGKETSATPVGLSKGFAPIEQYNQSLQDFSPVSDIYSLGATLYNLLTGTTPPEAPTIYDEGLGERPANISEKVWNIIGAAMKPSRRERPQSMSTFLGYLKGTIPVPTPGASKLPPIPPVPVTPAADDNDVVITGRGGATPPPPPGANQPKPASNPEPATEPKHVQQPKAPVFEESEETRVVDATPGYTLKPATPEIKPTTSEPQATPTNPYEQRKKKSFLIPIIVGVVMALIVAVGLFFAINHFDLFGNSTTTSTETDIEAVEEGDRVEDFPVRNPDGSVAFVYTGTMLDGQPNGSGVAKYNDSDKDTYTGKFIKGLRVDENATLTFKNGDVYKGSFENDQYVKGTYTVAADKSYFKGTFKNYNPYTGEWYDKSGNLISKVVDGAYK